MEIWDAYLADGTLAGCDLVRGEPIPKGLYHLVSEILVRHTDGDYLLMQRDPRKPNYGGYFEATAGGSALKGEDALTCAKRELREETGIVTGTLSKIGRFVSHMDISARGCNRDGAPLRFVAEQLSKRPEEVRILMLVSDGQPSAPGYGGTAAEEDLRGIKQEYKRKGILFVAAAIGDDKQNIERIYGDSFRVTRSRLKRSGTGIAYTGRTNIVSCRMRG